MIHYRIYVTANGAQVSGPPAVEEYPDDRAAIEKAKQLLDSGPLEVWNFARFAARLDPSHKMVEDVPPPPWTASLDSSEELLKQQVSTCILHSVCARHAEARR